jgi:signal transduction histidine kinase
VGALAQAARDWADERSTIHLPRTGVTELDALSRALAETTAMVSTQRAELKELNASLEVRVAERTRELAEATASLAQAQKMEAIGRLTGGVAHDFNNLLMAMLGNIDLLARRLTDPKHLRYAEQARAAGERGAKLTAQLLAFSRRQRIEARPMDIAASVEAAADLLGPALGGAHWLSLDLELGLWPAIGDPTQVELVVVNLALNARDATPGGGEVKVSAANTVRETASAAPEGPGAGEFVMLAVADHGEGMAPDVVARVFEPFFTTKAVGKGSGLGLPQVLGLAKQLGGGVEIETAAGAGTTVRVYLPRASAAPASALAEPPAQSGARLAGRRILLVDDNSDVRKATAQMLAELGCEVVEAESGAAALEQLAAHPALDGAVVDFAMPGLNGAETAARMRERRPDLPVVLMTGYADLDELNRGWPGAVMHKPFTLDALADQVSRLVEGSD